MSSKQLHYVIDISAGELADTLCGRGDFLRLDLLKNRLNMEALNAAQQSGAKIIHLNVNAVLSHYVYCSIVVYK